jgi:hypothetical protein
MNQTHEAATSKLKTHPHHAPPGAHANCCPSCGSFEVHQCSRTGLFEHFTLRLKMKAPFLCLDCGHRFYDSALS